MSIEFATGVTGYNISITSDTLTDGTPVFMVENPELPGCKAQGYTLDEAIAILASVRENYLAACVRDSVAVPPPGKQTISSDRPIFVV